MEFELSSDYLLKDGFDNKNNFDHLSDTLNETLPPTMKNVPESDFITDHTVPVGWSYKRVGGSLTIYSPDGLMFKSRRQIFEAMIASGKHSFEDINNMKYYLQFEGWQESDKIPFGWRIKIKQGKKFREIFLMEQGGKRFGSVSEAVRFIRTYQKYYRESDAEILMKNFLGNREPKTSPIPKPRIRTKTRRKVIIDASWNIDDNIYPTGWSYKDVLRNGVKMYERIVSKDGFVFRGKRAALAFMIKNNFRNEDQEKLRNSLQKDGWLSHFSLPEHWLYKNTNRGSIFSNEDGIKLGNLDTVKEHLEKVGQTSFIQNLQEFDKLNSYGPPNSQPTRETNQNQSFLEGWKSDELLYPGGWK